MDIETNLSMARPKP